MTELSTALNTLSSLPTPPKKPSAAEKRREQEAGRTHLEKFFQFPELGTVFMRQEVIKVKDGGEVKPWYATTAVLSPDDVTKYDRKIGRTIARRRYFTDDKQRSYLFTPNYETAVAIMVAAHNKMLTRKGVKK
jgi:hypothetical protein